MPSDSSMKEIAVDLLQSLKDMIYYIDIQKEQAPVRNHKGTPVKNLPAYELAKERIQKSEERIAQNVTS